jgi:hypothetical protein
VALDVQRCRTELDQLEAELAQWHAPDPPGLGVWRHKMFALIGGILDPNHALAIRFSGLHFQTRASSVVSGFGGAPVRSMGNPWAGEDFKRAQQGAIEIIEALRWELDRRTPSTDPVTDATVDPELWDHVRGLIEARDWTR